jgi:hypothetical protein
MLEGISVGDQVDVTWAPQVLTSIECMTQCEAPRR